LPFLHEVFQDAFSFLLHYMPGRLSSALEFITVASPIKV
jgi:hypothetical protein